MAKPIYAALFPFPIAFIDVVGMTFTRKPRSGRLHGCKYPLLALGNLIESAVFGFSHCMCPSSSNLHYAK